MAHGRISKTRISVTPQADDSPAPTEFPPPFTGRIDRDPRLDFDYTKLDSIPSTRSTLRKRALAVLAFIGAWTGILGVDAVVDATVNLGGVPARLGGAMRALGETVLSLFR